MGQPNFRNANLMPGGPLGVISSSVTLTADDQFVGTQGVGLIRISSNDTNPFNRDFSIQSGPNPTVDPAGNLLLILNFTSGSNTSCRLPNSGNVRLIADWTPSAGQSLALQWDGSFWNELARTGGGFIEISGSLTQSQIQTMFTTPITLLPAPLSNQAYIIQGLEFFHSYSTAAYTGGGDVQLQYDSGATAIILADVTLVTAASSLRTFCTPTIYNLNATAGTSTGFDLSTALGKSVTLTNLVAVFAAGNAANVLKWKLRYTLQTVLS